MKHNSQKSNSTVEQIHQSLLEGFFHHLDGQVQRTSHAQMRFLENRRSGLLDMAQMISGQIPGEPRIKVKGNPPVMNSHQLDAFGVGSLTDCLGPDYAIYEGRRTPRIPNGDLKLMTRVIEIHGEPGIFNRPASVVTEYDVPVDVWFLRENAYPTTPYSVFMEMALQPCGILSAWIRTMLQSPDIDFYFRNLDGWAELLQDIDLRGKTITARADLLSSLSTGDTIIQKFRFELSCSNVPIYRGESSFGYFSPQAMQKQLGLDGGKVTRPQSDPASLHLTDIHSYTIPTAERPFFHLPASKLQFLNQSGVLQKSGRYGEGYVYASKAINPGDWFYDCHFYQDPVMPGSLGIEAILQALQILAIETGIGEGIKAARFGIPVGEKMTWKYRGQITPAHQKMELEAHVSGIERLGNKIILKADASLWVDHIRIYEVKQAAISLLEG
jgi:3-hydroxymyristoyl/3-hydroxydecanoyl-(acyl carrier protein) dehydratase